MHVLSSRIENAHWAEKTTTTRCDIRETATTRNVALEKQPQREMWHYRNNHNAKCGIRETATTRNFALWKLQWK